MDYSSSKWKKKRSHILRMDGYKDRVALRYGKTLPADHVHHIYPAREFPEYQWADWNLISVSKMTHETLENRKSGELSRKGLELQRKTIPGVDWRRNKKGTAPR